METIVKGNAQEMQEPKSRPGRSNFPMHTHNFGTYRFGEYGVHLVKNGIASDEWKNRNGQEVRSYTLAEPLMNPIGLNKDYFFVPRMALLPKAWDLIYTNPVNGDDIDSTEYGTSVKGIKILGFLQGLASYSNHFYNISESWDEETAEGDVYYEMNKFFKWITLTEAVFSWGSLSAALEAPFAQLWKGEDNKSFDDLYEKFYDLLVKYLESCTVILTDDDNYYHIRIPSAAGVLPDLPDEEYGTAISIRTLISKLRDGENLSVLGIYTSQGDSMSIDDLLTLWNGTVKEATKEHTNVSLKIRIEKPFDLARLWSYQMIVAQYYSNDKVDYVYSAELFRNVISSYITEYRNLVGQGEIDTYQWNGITLPVDWLSGHYFTTMAAGGLDEIFDTETVPGTSKPAYAYFLTLFSFKRSLKFMDYFTGSRTQPLAVGDTKIPVQSGTYVDVVDVSKKIQAQRYLNKVKQIGRKIEEYTKAIFGIDVKQDYHEAIYLGHTSDTIGTRNIENTAEAQMEKEISVTCTFTNNGSRYEFTYVPDRDGIIMGILSFDIQRSYFRGFDRSYFHVNRFDFFNPYMQYTGDQPVYKEELNIANNGTFGYKNAYAEFKEGTNRAWGGFITALKGWTFLDRMYKNRENEETNPDTHIGPEFIRARAEELDRFYLKLTGWSLANYFHFIIDNYNEVDAVRPMSVNPQILG